MINIKYLKILIISLLILSCKGQSKAETSIETDKKQPSHPLTVKGMREYNFPKTPIKVERLIHNNEKYKSEEISFQFDGIKQYALISTPKVSKPPKGYPVILLLHGYIHPRKYSTVKSYSGIFNRYARSEFSVVKIDFRGHDRSEYGEKYRTTLTRLYYAQDLRQLIASLPTLDYINIDQIFIMGHSNGGDVALRTLASYPDKILGASLWGPVTAKLEESNFFWSGGGKKLYGDRALNLPEAQQDLIDSGSHLDRILKSIGIKSRDEIRYYPYLSDIKTPLIIRHPDTDESVPFSWTLKFKKIYENSGNPLPLEIINYPGDNHNISKNQANAQRDDLNWFRSLLNTSN